MVIVLQFASISKTMKQISLKGDSVKLQHKQPNIC